MEPLFVQPAVMISNARIQTVICKIENQNAIIENRFFIETVFLFALEPNKPILETLRVFTPWFNGFAK